MNARAVRADAGYVLRAWVRGRSGVVVSLAVPIILLVGLGLLRPGAAEPPLVHVVDLAGTEASKAFLEALAASPALRVETIERPPQDLAAWMHEHDARGYVEVPPDPDGTAPPRVVVDGAHAADAATVRDAVAAALAPTPLAAEEIRLPAPVTYGAFLLPGVIGLTILTVGLPLGFASVVELRQHGLMERLAVSPMTRREWLLARMLGASVVAIGSAVLLVLIAWAVLGVAPTLSPWTPLLVVAGTLVFSGLGALLAGAIRRPETGSAILNLLLFPIVLLSGSFFDTALLPASLRWLSLASPLTHVNAGLRLDALRNDAIGAAIHAGALLLVATLLLAAGSRLVRWTE